MEINLRRGLIFESDGDGDGLLRGEMRTVDRQPDDRGSFGDA